nr:DUF4494 domain-containing protein [uncultured Bacteroides sp.]
MMYHNWFESKVRYEKTMENGKVKKVVEPYLVDALSFTEAEARTIEEVTPFISGEFSIMAIKRASYDETFLNEGGDRYFKCRLAYITLDEKSGAEKKTKQNILVQANTLQDAKDYLVEQMKGTMSDYTIEMVKETDIMDVYPYAAKEEKK